MPTSTDSILDNVKKLVGVEPDYTAFDLDLIIHINSVFSTLQQLGIGPDEAFMIEDREKTWADLLGTAKNLNAVKSYVYLRVRLLFDPPASSFAIDSMQKQANELEWRLMVQAEPVGVVVEDKTTLETVSNSDVDGMFED